MSEILSLAYFDAIFEPRSAAYRDLLETLIQMGGDYALDYKRAVLDRDEATFAEVRHKNVTFIENLGLHGLREVQLQAKVLVAQGASDQKLKDNVELFRMNMDEVKKQLEEILAKDYPR